MLSHIAILNCDLAGSVVIYATDDGSYYSDSITDARSDLVGDTLTFYVMGYLDGSAAS